MSISIRSIGDDLADRIAQAQVEGRLHIGIDLGVDRGSLSLAEPEARQVYVRRRQELVHLISEPEVPRHGR